MFSTISNLVFPDNTAMFLFMLAILTFAFNAISFFFVRSLPPHPESLIFMSHNHSDSQVLHRSKSQDSGGQPSVAQEAEGPTSRKPADVSLSRGDCDTVSEEACADTHEASSLLSKSSDSSPEEYGFRRTSKDQLEEVDIRGLDLLAKPYFWQLFFMFGLLTGIGLMNIK